VGHEDSGSTGFAPTWVGARFDGNGLSLGGGRAQGNGYVSEVILPHGVTMSRRQDAASSALPIPYA